VRFGFDRVKAEPEEDLESYVGKKLEEKSRGGGSG
jgi:hypothetical protein